MHYGTCECYSVMWWWFEPGLVPGYNWCSLHLTRITTMFAAYLFAFHNWNWQNQKWNPQMPTFPCTIYETTHKTKTWIIRYQNLAHWKSRGGVSHYRLCHFTLKSILRQKKNYGNSNISPCKKYNLKKKSSKKNQNPSRYYYNSIITNLKFQHKPKYHLSKILI